MVVRDARLRILAKGSHLPVSLLTNNALFIGGLQGAANDVLTKLSSRRQKPAMVFSQTHRDGSCQFAQVFQAKDYSCGNDAHVYRSWRYMDKERKCMPTMTRVLGIVRR
ncbi:hypothetical protein KCP70_20860 [Salmonella enterica subsp. enterica]|nr:hypothetical protein KCP70_20860 [Salmonella enterica subsp. enterica]